MVLKWCVERVGGWRLLFSKAVMRLQPQHITTLSMECQSCYHIFYNLHVGLYSVWFIYSKDHALNQNVNIDVFNRVWDQYYLFLRPNVYDEVVWIHDRQICDRTYHCSTNTIFSFVSAYPNQSLLLSNCIHICIHLTSAINMWLFTSKHIPPGQWLYCHCYLSPSGRT